MPLADRLKKIEPNRSNDGCRTCQWLTTLSEEDHAAFHQWINNGNSLMQLHKACAADPDNPIPISLSALRNHLRECKK